MCSYLLIYDLIEYGYLYIIVINNNYSYYKHYLKVADNYPFDYLQYKDFYFMLLRKLDVD